MEQSYGCLNGNSVCGAVHSGKCLLCVLVSLIGGLLKPFRRCMEITRHILAGQKNLPECILRIRMSLYRSLSKPLKCLRHILWNKIPLIEHFSETVLCLRHSGLRSFLQPFQSLLKLRRRDFCFFKNANCRPIPSAGIRTVISPGAIVLFVLW